MKYACLMTVVLLGLLGAGAAPSVASTLTIETGDADVKSATATAAGGARPVDGTVEKGKVTFDKVLPGERYDVALKLADGQTLRLVDLAWHSDAPADPKAAALDDDDKTAIKAIVTDIKTFTNKNTILQLTGTGERAVALMELIRDTDFHDGKGNVIWRIEVWYFENQAGGWAKVQQANRVVERVRFDTPEACEKHRKALNWLGIPSGLKIERNKDSVVTLPKPGK